MKKKILNIAVLFTFVLSLTACGNSSEKEADTTTNNNSTMVTSTEEVTTDEPTTVHEHSYAAEVTKEATCTENGERTFTCACGDVYTEVIAAPGHYWGTYTYNNDATPEANGTKTATCNVCGGSETIEAENTKISYTYTDMNTTMYTTTSVNVRKYPTSDSAKLGSISKGDEVKITGKCNETSWYRIEFNGGVAYMTDSYLTATKPVTVPEKYQKVYQKALKRGHEWKIVNGFFVEIYPEGDEWDFLNTPCLLACEAGYFNPVYYAEKEGWVMLFPTEDTEKWLKDERFAPYVEELLERNPAKANYPEYLYHYAVEKYFQAYLESIGYEKRGDSDISEETVCGEGYDIMYVW